MTHYDRSVEGRHLSISLMSEDVRCKCLAFYVFLTLKNVPISNISVNYVRIVEGRHIFTVIKIRIMTSVKIRIRTSFFKNISTYLTAIKLTADSKFINYNV